MLLTTNVSNVSLYCNQLHVSPSNVGNAMVGSLMCVLLVCDLGELLLCYNRPRLVNRFTCLYLRESKCSKWQCEEVHNIGLIFVTYLRHFIADLYIYWDVNVSLKVYLDRLHLTDTYYLRVRRQSHYFSSESKSLPLAILPSCS